MCGVCDGKIVLRSVDGLEKVVSVPDCEMRHYRVPYSNKQSYANYMAAAAADTFPSSCVPSYREYENSHRKTEAGITIFEEVVPKQPEPVRPDSKVAALDTWGEARYGAELCARLAIVTAERT